MREESGKLQVGTGLGLHRSKSHNKYIMHTLVGEVDAEWMKMVLHPNVLLPPTRGLLSLQLASKVQKNKYINIFLLWRD